MSIEPSAGKELEHALTPPSAGMDEEDAKSAQPDSVPDRTDTEKRLIAEDHQALTMTEQEVVCLEQICRPMAMTPRRLLRLLNSYQVARASLADGAVVRFNEGGYRAFAALLSAVVAWPEWTPQILDGLAEAPDWSGVLAAVPDNDTDGVRDRVKAWCDILEDEGIKVADVRAYTKLALRFSFVAPYDTTSELINVL